MCFVFRRIRSALLLTLLLCVAGPVMGQAARRAEPGRTPRILVKLRAPLAEEGEAALAAKTIAVASAQSLRLREFLTRYSGRTLTPLYPEIVKAKQQRRISDLQIAQEIRQRFAKRATRLRATFNPPEISRTYVMELAGTPVDLVRVLARLQADPDVEYAEEDKTVSVCDAPNDPYLGSSGSWGQIYDDLWGIKKIGAPAAWETTAGDGVVVAVVDTGIDYNHPDIAANIWTNPGEVADNGGDDDRNGFVDDVRGWNFISDSNNPIDDYGHGTAVAGTIAAVGNNGIGVIGVAWRAKVMPLKALGADGSGQDSVLAKALVYAANNGADVISNSWGGAGASQTTADAVDYAYNLGVVIVAAAGNDNLDARGYWPANLPKVITVAASDSDDNKASFSNWGSKIDVAAPGVDILSLHASGTSLGILVGADYARMDGTSMAAPHVAGLAALILSQHPEYSNEDVRQAIRFSAQDLGPGLNFDFGYGRVDASRALSLSSILEAKITSPSDGTKSSSAMTISGVARGSGFARYTLEYGAGVMPDSWTTLQTGSVEVQGVLGVFDPGNVDSGLYTIRLTAYNTAGQIFQDRIQVVTAAVVISSPGGSVARSSAVAFKPGATIPIVGSVMVSGFQSFHVDWQMDGAPGLNSSSDWSAEGIALTGAGAIPITEGVLATWTIPAVSKAAYCTIRLRVAGEHGTRTTTRMVYLEPDLLSSVWPRWLESGPGFNSGVVPAVDADGITRLSLASPAYWGWQTPERPDLGGQDGALWTLPLDGPAQKWSLPSSSSSQPAVADLDGKSGDEVVVADVNDVRVYRDDGGFTELGWTGSSFNQTQIATEDLDGDGRAEILAVGDVSGTASANVFAWRPDGSVLNSNFPLRVENQGYSGSAPLRLISGDFDGDGKKEIVVQETFSARSFTLRLFGADGSPRTWKVPVLDGLPYAMIAADLEHNGTLETILVASMDNQPVLHVFEPDGTERAGFPVQLPYPQVWNQYFLAAGDLDRDGREEIVLSHFETLYVFRDDGSPFSMFWPMHAVYPGFGTVLLGDVDGDGFPEIVTVRTSPLPLTGHWSEPELVAFHSDGTLVRSWRLTGMGKDIWEYQFPTPTIGDFNGDGLTEIAVAYMVADTSMSGVVTVLKTGAPYNPLVNDWPMVYQNPRNTAVRQTTTEIYSIRNAASQLPGPVAPDELVAISGTQLSASQYLSDISGASLPTSLGGASVLFDSVSAPLLYAESGRIYAVVPDGVAGKTSTLVQVQSPTALSSPVAVAVAATAPGLFTIGGQGSGPAAAVNQDGAPNSAPHPAPWNSTVQLYATGAGKTSLSAMSATIGGLAASIVSVESPQAGMVRIGVRVPSNSPTGNAVPVMLKIGSATSQPGVTLAVRAAAR